MLDSITSWMETYHADPRPTIVFPRLRSADWALSFLMFHRMHLFDVEYHVNEAKDVSSDINRFMNGRRELARGQQAVMTREWEEIRPGIRAIASRFVPLKAAGVCGVYHLPEHRLAPCGDIDFLVAEEDLASVAAFLKVRGYRQDATPERIEYAAREMHHLETFRKDFELRSGDSLPVFLEVHRNIYRPRQRGGTDIDTLSTWVDHKESGLLAQLVFTAAVLERDAKRLDLFIEGRDTRLTSYLDCLLLILRIGKPYKEILGVAEQVGARGCVELLWRRLKQLWKTLEGDALGTNELDIWLRWEDMEESPTVIVEDDLVQRILEPERMLSIVAQNRETIARRVDRLRDGGTSYGDIFSVVPWFSGKRPK